MCGGGTQTTTQQVSIPPEVMARYNSVNARAEGVANQPFQQYGGEFVAPLNEVQQQGIQATGQASQSAQPYYQMGTGLTLAGTQAVGPLTSGQISTYMNPYIEGVVDPTLRALQQQQGQQLSQQQAEAIKGGAFGGERSGIQRAMLQGQQNLATGQAIAPLYAQGYQQAVQTATGQQGVKAQDLARLAQAGQQIAGLGTAAQGSALQGAQAQIAAGTLGQQTAQAQKTAEYQQFLQERGYPYQQAQFLANIAMGTGALSGSTTTTESPAGFFSDKRLKENVKVVGETNDGQPIYRYNYKGEKKTQLGLIAQEVEKDHPEAVGESQGYKTVDYKKATDDSVRHHRAYGGGLDVNAFGGAVTEPGSYAGGGLVDSTDLSAILAQQKNFFGPYGKGLAGEGSIGGASGIPAANLAVPKLVTASGMPQQQRSGLSQAAETGSSITGLYKSGKSALVGDKGEKGLIGNDGKMGDGYLKDLTNFFSETTKAHGGGVMPHGYAVGGEINPYALSADPMADVVQEGTQKAPELTKPGQAPGVKSPMSDVKDAASAASGVASAITAMMAMFSDERMKDNKEKIGKLFDGQPVYRYDFGDGNTQIGLMAQNVEKSHPEAVHETSNGIKMVNYDAATRDAANDRHGYSFGGMPRQGYATEGAVAEPSELDEPTLRTLSKFEGYREKPYWDVNALRTGFGSDTVTLPSGEVQKVGQDTRVSMSDAIRDLKRRSAASQGQIATAVGDEAWRGLDPNAQAALTSIAYNYGHLPESVANAVKSGDRATIGSAINSLGTANEGVNAKRRAEEASMVHPEGAYAPTRSGVRPPPSNQASAEKKGDLSFASMLPTQKDSSGKESTNWEKVLIPLLSGVGSALSSQRNTLGGALGEGLLGGIGGYQSISKMQAEIPKIEAETQQTQSEVKRIDQVTKGLAAGLWETTPVAGVGLIAYDKSDPLNRYVLTDANFKPVPLVEGRLGPMGITPEQLETLRKTGQLPPGAKIAGQTDSTQGQATEGQKPGAPATQEGGITDIKKAVPVAKNFMEWNPVTEPPKEYRPPQQIDRASIPGTAASDLAAGQKRSAEVTESAARSGKGQLMLTRLMDDYSRLPKDGPLAAGAYAEQRLKKLGEINDVLGTLGMKKLDVGSDAAAQAIQKGNFQLAAELASSIGTRVSNQIVSQTITNNPSIRNSPLAFQLISQALIEDANYESDRAKYVNSYFGRFNHTRTADTDFAEVNKPEFYAKRAAHNAMNNYLLSNPKIGNQSVDGRAAIDSLKAYIAKNPEEKDAAKKQFDKTLGVNGAANMVLGEF